MTNMMQELLLLRLQTRPSHTVNDDNLLVYPVELRIPFLKAK
jgi:hypothetical protein